MYYFKEISTQQKANKLTKKLINPLKSSDNVCTIFFNNQKCCILYNSQCKQGDFFKQFLSISSL